MRMRHGAAFHLRVQHAGQDMITGKNRLARDFAQRVAALYALTNN
jgi:hypothetical protein